MAEEEEFVPYKDISQLKKELSVLKSSKDVSVKDLHDSIQKLTQAMSDILDVFSAAAEQLKIEEKGSDIETKKHDTIIYKLDKLIDQNRTIAEAMVDIVDMIKEKMGPAEKEKDGSFFKQSEPRVAEPSFVNQHEWDKPEETSQPMQPQFTPSMPPQFTPPMSQASQQPSPFPIQPPYMTTPQMPGFEMPPMEPAPPPDLDFPDEPFPSEEPKKKGLFRMFKK